MTIQEFLRKLNLSKVTDKFWIGGSATTGPAQFARIGHVKRLAEAIQEENQRKGLAVTVSGAEAENYEYGRISLDGANYDFFELNVTETDFAEMGISLSNSGISNGHIVNILYVSAVQQFTCVIIATHPEGGDVLFEALNLPGESLTVQWVESTSRWIVLSRNVAPPEVPV
jgi:hypothetical protein